MVLIEQLLRVADTYCAATGRSRSRVSTLVFNDGKTLDLVARTADLGTRRFEKAMVWFHENWPAGTDWPEGIDRPSATPEALAG